jgi:hypothetical protein
MDASTKIIIAQISAQQKPEVTAPDNNLGELVAMHGDLMNGVAMAVQAMQAPKRRILERGPDGKATGVIEITGDTGQ